MGIESASQVELLHLVRENARLQRLAETLMDRVERMTNSANSPFGFFQINATLSQQVTQQQEALRDSQQTLQIIFNAVPVGVFLFDADLRICRVNDHAESVLGQPVREMMGRSIGQIIDCPNATGQPDECGRMPRCLQCVLQRLLKEARQIGRAQGEHEFTLPVGLNGVRRRVWLSLKADAPMIAGRQHLLVMMEDISSKKEAEQELQRAKEMAEEASRLKSHFLSNVSHEIRTPLNGMMGFAEAILHSTSLETAREHAQVILRESQVLLMLVNDLLDLVKIESGKLAVEHVAVDVTEVLRELHQTLGMQARGKGLNYVASVAIDAPRRIMSDPLRLRQILLNLVSNAIKFTDRGEVRVTVECLTGSKEPFLRFMVRDTGIGIAPDKQQMIFDSFAQADLSTTRKYGGTGLGLAIVRQLTRLMGGDIGVESAPGQGSTFWFTLPAEAAAESVSAPAEKPLVNTRAVGMAGQARILFAEDYPTNQQIARLFLEQAGHEVTIVSNGREAVELCATASFDLILMDLHMPIMDGMAAMAAIRKQGNANARIPILSVSASADAQTQAMCLKSGFNAMLTKPIRRETLLFAVEHWLEQSPGDAATEPREVVSETADETAAPMDMARAVEEFGTPMVVESLLRQFLDHAEIQLVMLNEAARAPQRDTMRETAHALKGAAATLEAAPLASMAGKLEAASMAAAEKDLQSLVTSLGQEIKRLRTYAESRAPLLKDAEHANHGG